VGGETRQLVGTTKEVHQLVHFEWIVKLAQSGDWRIIGEWRIVGDWRIVGVRRIGDWRIGNV